MRATDEPVSPGTEGKSVVRVVWPLLAETEDHILAQRKALRWQCEIRPARSSSSFSQLASSLQLEEECEEIRSGKRAEEIEDRVLTSFHRPVRFKIGGKEGRECAEKLDRRGAKSQTGFVDGE